jgi:hypothetical protein
MTDDIEMIQQANDSRIPDLAKLEISPSSPSVADTDPDSSAIPPFDRSTSPERVEAELQYLPYELISIITGEMGRKEERADNHPDGKIPAGSYRGWYDADVIERRKMREVLLPLSSVCRALRRSLLREISLSHLTVVFCEKDWESLVLLSEEYRSYIT